jgi:hypothetical protein
MLALAKLLRAEPDQIFAKDRLVLEGNLEVTNSLPKKIRPVPSGVKSLQVGGEV